LEDRDTPAIAWTGTAGTYLWGDPGNWSTNAVPTAADDVSITVSVSNPITISGANFSVRSLNDTTGVLSIASGASLNLAAASATSNFGTNVTVNAGGTLAVVAGANVSLAQNITLTDNGTVSFASGDTVAMNSSSVFGSAQIMASTGGALRATGTTFTNPGSGTPQITFASDAAVGAGDLSGDAFDVALSVPAVDLQYLSGGSNSNLRFKDINVTGSLTGGQTAALNAIGTQTTANLRYVFPANYTVGAGATLSVGPGVNVSLAQSITLTVNGTVSFASGDAVAMNSSSVFGSAQIVSSGGGALRATGTTFTNPGSGTPQITFASDAAVSAGDLSGNAFDVALAVPAVDLRYLSGGTNNNLRFKDINVTGGLTTGQTAALNAIGSQTTANLRYVFPANFTVGSGATMSVGPGVNVALAQGTTLTVNGTATFGSGDTVVMNSSSVFGSAQIVSSGGGALRATGTTFTNPGNGTPEITFASDAAVGTGDLSGNAFDVALSVPAVDLQYLSGGTNNNLRFKDINVTGALTSGQTAALNAIGTQTTANLRYVFPASFTVGSGGTMGVGPGVNVALAQATTLTVNGTATFGSGDTVVMNSSSVFGSAQIVSSGGGALRSTGTTFTNPGNGTPAVTFASDAAVGTGDLSGNAFDVPLFVPAVDLQFLSGGTNNNLRFKDVNVTGALTAGQSAALNLIGTQTTANLRYVFPANFTVGSGATLSSGQGVSVLLAQSTTLTVNGTATFASGDAVTLNSSSVFGSAQIVASGGGSLQTTGTTFTNGGNGTPAIVINSGGQIQASTSRFALGSLTLNSGSNATLSFDVISNQLPINSGATINIANNDLTNIAANGVIATGTPSATINLTNNYWGTTAPAGIAAKILDHVTDATRPTVNFTPFLTAEPTQVSGSNASAPFNSAVQNASLTATVISPLGAVNSGTATFTLLNGATVLGTPTTANVISGVATASYSVPAALPIGTYTIKVVYNGNASFLASAPDATHQFTITATGSATAVSNATGNFSTSNQNVALHAAVNSPTGTVSEGTLTFTVLQGGIAVGTPVTVNVTGGAADATYVLPGGTPATMYTIRGDYSGTVNYAASTDSSHTLTVGGTSTSTAAGSTSTAFSSVSQAVTLNATVNSSAGTVSEGMETFTIFQGTTQIGTPVMVAVSGGAAVASYTLPAGTALGTYTIQAAYTDATGNFTGSGDNTHQLTVGTASSATAASAASAVFGDTSVALNASVTSGGNPVGEGNVTFTVLQGATTIGSPVTVPVSAGAANTSYALPTGLAAGTYTIQAVYNGTGNFTGSTDATHTLVINPAASTTAGSSATAVFISSTQSVNLSATFSSLVGTVNSGTATFTILQGVTVIGSPVTVNVSAGAASTIYVLPVGLSAGTYKIEIDYSGSTNFVASSDTTHTLVISAAGSSTVSADASVVFSSSTQSVNLGATFSSLSGAVNSGTATFTILQGTTVIGSPVTVNVSAGSAGAVYALPAGLAAGTYTIQVAYDGTTNVTGSSTNQTLIIAAFASSTASAGATATFRPSSQSVTLSANFTSSGGTVTGGTATFTVLQGATVIGSPVTVNVSGGTVSPSYLLPAGLAAGTYTIQVTYNGTTTFAGSGDSTQTLVISSAGSSTTSADASVVFSSSAQSVNLSADFTSPVGTLNVGTATFTVLQGTTVIGTPVTVNVSAGAAGAAYALPAGLAAGTYTIRVDYSGTTNIATSSTTQTLLVSTYGSSTASPGATTAPSSAAQSINLSATFSSPGGTVNGGTATFTVLQGSTVIGTPVTVPVSGGTASATYVLPAGTAAGSYTIQVVYNGTTTYAVSNGTQTLIIAVPVVAPPPAPVRVPASVTGAAQGAPGQVTVFDGSGSQLHQFTPFPGWTGGYVAALGDVTGDGVSEIVLATSSLLPVVIVLNASTGAIENIFLIPRFHGGVSYLLTLNLLGNGHSQIVAIGAKGGVAFIDPVSGLVFVL
jgi:hypothetical protein